MPRHEENIVLYNDANVEQFRISPRGKPLSSEGVTSKTTFLTIDKGAPLIQLLSGMGDSEAMMRCAFPARIRDIPRTSKQCGEISLVMDDDEAIAFFNRLDAQMKREILKSSDFTPEQVEDAYIPIHQVKDESFPGRISATIDPPFGFDESLVYRIVEWTEGVLRHSHMTRMKLEEKVTLLKRDAQVVAAVLRLSGFSVKLDKHGVVKIYPSLSLARIAVYAPPDEDAFE